MDSGSDERVLLEEIDAVGGLKIEVWSEDLQHALEGHPEVTIERIRSATKKPCKVIESKYSKTACLFYSIEQADLSGETTYFCVVVGVLGSGKGKLETAYETTYIKKGKVLYPEGDKL